MLQSVVKKPSTFIKNGEPIIVIHLSIFVWETHTIKSMNIKEKEVYELGLSLFPEYPRIISNPAICALSQGDTENANELIIKYKSIRKNIGLWPESRILSGVGYIYSNANLFDEAELHFRQALKLDPMNPARLNDLAWFLIDHDINVDEGVDLIHKSLEIRARQLVFIRYQRMGFI